MFELKKSSTLVSDSADNSRDIGPIVFAKANRVKSSIKKMIIVVNLVRGLSAIDAVQQLKFYLNRRRAAHHVLSLLESVIANAEQNYGLDVYQLEICEIYTTKGTVLKRFTTRARGKSSTIRKPNVHLFISLRRKFK